MKTSLILILTLVLTIRSNVNAQSLTFSDIVYGMNHTLSETEDYLSVKGYKYLNKQEFFMPRLQKYVFSRIQNNAGIQYGVVIDEVQHKIVQIQIIMSSKENSLAIKNKIKQLGYKLSNTPEDTVDGEFSSKYRKGGCAIQFITDKDEEFGVYYEISYWDNSMVK